MIGSSQLFNPHALICYDNAGVLYIQKKSAISTCMLIPYAEVSKWHISIRRYTHKDVITTHTET